LILSGILGSMVLVGNAEACHGKRNKCSCATPVVRAVVVQPAPCVQTVGCVKPKRALCAKPASCLNPVVYAKPAVCAKPVAKCGPKVKLCQLRLPTLCRTQAVPAVACAGPVCAVPVSYAVVYPAPQAVPAPQR